MKTLLTAALFFVLNTTATAQNLRIVNAASLSAVSVSPGSIVTIFGTQLTTGVAYATDVKTPPTTLGGVSVTIGASSAALFYVSPTQINYLVPAGLQPGIAQVTVELNDEVIAQGALTINEVAPSLFTADASGKTQGYFTGCGFVPEFYESLRRIGVPLDLDIFERREPLARAA